MLCEVEAGGSNSESNKDSRSKSMKNETDISQDNLLIQVFCVLIIRTVMAQSIILSFIHKIYASIGMCS